MLVWLHLKARGEFTLIFLQNEKKFQNKAHNSPKFTVQGMSKSLKFISLFIDSKANT